MVIPRSTILYSIYVISALNIIFNAFLTNFSFIDEILTLVLLAYVLCYCDLKRRKEVLYFLGIYGFYFLYSLFFGRNIVKAVILDAFLFFKPFISFYAVYLTVADLDEKLRPKVAKIFYYLGFYCWLIAPFMNYLYGNNAAFYPCCLIASLSYYYFSDRSQKDLFISLFFLLPGLPTLRSKYFTICICFFFIFFVLKKKIKVNLTNILMICIIILLSIVLNYEKFSWYFIKGKEIGLARTYFYITSLDVLLQYFPFGSGFGTFGTEAAARYYSPVYYDYGMDTIWGLSPEDNGTEYDFLTDVFYPVLAQFGIVGVVLYVVFWVRRIIEAYRLNFQSYQLFVFLFLIIAIQNLADMAFTNSYIIPLMMLVAFSLREPTKITVPINEIENRN